MFKAILLEESDGKVSSRLPALGGDILKGRVRGRVVVDVRA